MYNYKQKLKRGNLITFLLIVIHFSILNGIVFSQETIVLGNIFAPPLSNHDGTGMLNSLYKEAFSRLGIKVKIIQFPGERSIIWANSGKIDGDLLRVKGIDIEGKFNNLIRIPEKVMDFEFVAFTTNIKGEMAGWDGLKPYRVVFVRGWQILHNNIKETRQVNIMNNSTSLFKHLNAGRADIAVYERYQGYATIKRLGLGKIHALEPPIIKREMFLYLHKKHRLLVPKVAKIFRDMKGEGTFRIIVDKELSPYIQLFQDKITN